VTCSAIKPDDAMSSITCETGRPFIHVRSDEPIASMRIWFHGRTGK